MTLFYTCSARNRQGYTLAMYCFSLLINAKDIETVINHLRHIFTLFGSKNIGDEVNASFKYLQDEVSHISDNDELRKQVEQIEETSMEEIIIDEDDEETNQQDEEESIRAVSKMPFLPYILKRLQKCNMTCDDTSLPVNDYFQPGFKELLEKKWLGMLPFWSGIMLGKYKT